MKRLSLALLLIPLCMGQSCSSSFLTAMLNAANDATDGSDSNNDGNGTNDDTTTPKGVPDGTYTGSQTIVQSLDNVTDAYPADSQTSNVAMSYTFSKGLLLRADGTTIKVGDVQTASTAFGDMAEQITAIYLTDNVTQYVTQPQMVMQNANGQSWNFSGSGVHTFRLTGDKVVYSGQVDMSSDTAGGVAYQASFQYSASLQE
jgi:hypothetical protein